MPSSPDQWTRTGSSLQLRVCGRSAFTCYGLDVAVPVCADEPRAGLCILLRSSAPGVNGPTFMADTYGAGPASIALGYVKLRCSGAL